MIFGLYYAGNSREPISEWNRLLVRTKYHLEYYRAALFFF